MLSLRPHLEGLSFLFKKENKRVFDSFRGAEETRIGPDKKKILIKMNEALKGFELGPLYIELWIMKSKNLK